MPDSADPATGGKEGTAGHATVRKSDATVRKSGAGSGRSRHAIGVRGWGGEGERVASERERESCERKGTMRVARQREGVAFLRSSEGIRTGASG